MTTTKATETAASPWHAGEVAMHTHAGVAQRLGEIGQRLIRDHLIDQHREFYPKLPFVVLGSVDGRGDAWATLRAARPGFLQTPDQHTLSVALARDPADPADAGMNDGEAIGLLGIELSTRRRNRLNGTIRRTGAAAFDIAVEQSFGNCPKYITLRQFEFSRDPAVPPAGAADQSDRLDARAQALIARADTLFVASYIDRGDGRRQIDVSHRGGKPGFVRVKNGVLTIPDFTGNQFFNTLGNLLINPRAGLVFADFTTGDLLQISGEGTVLLDAPDTAAFKGAERLWQVIPSKVVYREGAWPLRWSTVADGASPYSLATGSWDEAETPHASAAPVPAE